jgi:rod shape-determining protein MreD
MNRLWVVAGLTGALLLQSLIARYRIGSTMPVDFVLVAVAFAALLRGRVTGLLGGSFAGLAQDALSGGVLGIGGLAQSVAGFVTGTVGTQFIVSQAMPRFLVFFGAAVLHSTIYMGLYAVLGLRQFNRPVATATLHGVGNAVLGVLLFEAVEFLPGALERRRARRASARRKWF